MNKTNFYLDGAKTPLVYEHAIYGKCHGVLLSKRGLNDPHVCITVICEADFVSVMQEAQVWMDTHCDKAPSGYGYVFRS